MNDEFLKALRRDPPPQFARRLKQQLQAQDAQSKRRAWSRWIRMMLILIAGPVLAAGIFVFGRQSSERAQASPPPQVAAASQMGTMPARSNAVSAGPQPMAGSPAMTAPTEPEPLADIAPTRSRPAAKIATSPLADALIRNVLSGQRSGTRSTTPHNEPMEASVALGLLCTRDRGTRLDIVVTSRRITHSEFLNCRRDGFRLQEWKVGYQVLVLTSARDSIPMKLSASDVYLAVGKQIPDPLEPGRFVINSNFTWDQVNSGLAYRPIAIFGPARETPLRLLFESLLLEPGCNAQKSIEALRMTDPGRYADLCHSVRGDRLYSEVEQTASLIPQQLWADPNALLLVDYLFYSDNRSQLAGSMLEGPEPSPETFADGTYPLARPIYVYTDWGLLGRAEEGFEILHSLQSLRLPGPNRFGFVRLDERETRKHLSPDLSETDLIPERSTP